MSHGDGEACKNWPPETKTLFGLSPETTVTRATFESLLHPDDVERFEAAYLAATEPGCSTAFELVYRIRRADDKSERWIMFSGQVLCEGVAAGKLVGVIRDVTEEQPSLQHGANLSSLLALFIEHAPAPIAMFDLGMTYLAASAQWRKDFHLSDSLVGKCHYDVFPSIGEAWKGVHRRCLAGAIERSDGEKFVREDGAVQWVKWEVRPWRNQRDEIGGIIIFSEEITSQKRTEQALRQSQDRLLRASDNGRLTYVQFDLANDWLVLAENFPRTLGYKPRTPPVGGRLHNARDGLLAHVAEPDKAAVSAMFDDIFASRAGWSTFRVVGDDGAVRWFESTWDAESTLDGESAWDGEGALQSNAKGPPRRVFATLQDVTEAREREADLRRLNDDIDRQRHQFETLYRLTPAMMIWVSERGALIEASDLWLGVTGYSRAEVRDRRLAAFFDVDSAERMPDEVFAPIATQGACRVVPLRLITKDGKAREVELSAFRDLNAPSSRGCVAVLDDVTDRNRARKELERANRELAETNTGLERFARVASHDLQAPLRKISQFGELLLTDFNEGLNEEGRYVAEIMVREAQRMRRIVRDVLTFSRAANAPSEISEVVLDEIVAELKVELELTINESAAVIATSELPILRGDRSAIEQLLRNLIVNAIKFRRLDMAPHILASARTAPNGDCVLSLKDNGQGFPIPPDRTIFEPFVRMHADSGIEGAGLGLAICKSVCDRHGWTISVSSQAGEGSEFSIAVPASAVVEAPPNQ